MNEGFCLICNKKTQALMSPKYGKAGRYRKTCGDQCRGFLMSKLGRESRKKSPWGRMSL